MKRPRERGDSLHAVVPTLRNGSGASSGCDGMPVVVARDLAANGELQVGTGLFAQTCICFQYNIMVTTAVGPPQDVLLAPVPSLPPSLRAARVPACNFKTNGGPWRWELGAHCKFVLP